MLRKANNIPPAGYASHIPITGLQGTGKTTLIRGLANRLAEFKPTGLYTEEIRNRRGNREGFQVVTLCGRRMILSHVGFSGPSRVGRYGVDVAGFERRLLEN